MAKHANDLEHRSRRLDQTASRRPASADRSRGVALAGPAPPRAPGRPRPVVVPADRAGSSRLPSLPGPAGSGAPHLSSPSRPPGLTDPTDVDGPGERPVRPDAAARRAGAPTRRTGYNPALDGVRALAMLCVLVFHMDALPGGYLGVDVFFVLSGFLISRQLLAERDRTGRVCLPRFYLRRAYRLLPAFWMLVLVGFTAVVVLGVGTAGERDEFLHTLAAAMLYVNNYFQVVQQNTGAGWLGHTWSLSLEEQFYLLWPLLLLVLCRRPWIDRRLPVVLLGGVVVVMLWRDALNASGASATRTYFGLDTRADALLVGCALAAWLRARQRDAGEAGDAGEPGEAGDRGTVLPGRQRRPEEAAVPVVPEAVRPGTERPGTERPGTERPGTVPPGTVRPEMMRPVRVRPTFAWPVSWPGSARRVPVRPVAALPVVGAVAFVLLAVAMVAAPSGWGPRPTALARGGYTVIALLAGVVILALEVGATTGWLFRVLAVRPLAWLGRISYGFYLWHFPVVAHWGRDLTIAVGRGPAILVVGLISLGLASASYYLLERPIQRRRPDAARREAGEAARPAWSS
ncbi:acyltransferase [Frankia sp. R43]|uniref:acyltransferase family protein n=1 Tax=Frankia sp. R43 TaxID=269536 RepID=UPI0006CA2A41|nr:acyltransferase [Frankia sp. R43]KPM55059.1 acyltransferase [Frankia sp. R43]